jgi:hypothetical protein
MQGLLIGPVCLDGYNFFLIQILAFLLPIAGGWPMVREREYLRIYVVGVFFHLCSYPWRPRWTLWDKSWSLDFGVVF